MTSMRNILIKVQDFSLSCQIPAMVGEGVLYIEEKNSLLPEEREEIKKLFEAFGIVIELPVHLMGIGGALRLWPCFCRFDN